MSERAELEQAAIRLLTVREHSRCELQRKLQRRTEQGELIEAVLDSLQANGYQSDERFVEQYVDSRKRKGFGPVRIRMELQERGISPALGDAVTDPADTAWAELLERCCRHKFGSEEPADYRERAKRARFLEYRGFPTDLIRRCLWRDEF